MKAYEMYGINPYVLYAILKVESNLNPYAIEVISDEALDIPCNYVKKNGRYYYSCFPNSYDEALETLNKIKDKALSYSIGLGQINKYWIEKYDINPEKLFDACYNILWSAYILNECYRLFGNRRSIDCYNKGLKAKEISPYVIRVYNVLLNLSKK